MRTKGFTLLELIIAIAIFALISAMTYPSMIQILDLGNQAQQQADRLTELQKAMTIIARDVRQIVDRPVRDSFGSEEKAVVGGTGSTAVLAFSRSGWRNPVGMARPHLQRVAYLLADETLIRQSWYVLDRASDTLASEQPLMGEVKAVEVRFMDDAGKWQDFWPPVDPTKPPLPQAIGIAVELEDWGRINRVFRIAHS